MMQPRVMEPYKVTHDPRPDVLSPCYRDKGIWGVNGGSSLEPQALMGVLVGRRENLPGHYSVELHILSTVSTNI